MGESEFFDKYWKFSTINTDQNPLKNFNFFCQKCIPHLLKKTHQIYMNLKNCLDLCQKNWNQSKYWKLSPMHLNYNQILKILPTTFLHLSQTRIWISISIWCCLFYVQRFEIEVVAVGTFFSKCSMIQVYNTSKLFHKIRYVTYNKIYK